MSGINSSSSYNRMTLLVLVLCIAVAMAPASINSARSGLGRRSPIIIVAGSGGAGGGGGNGGAGGSNGGNGGNAGNGGKGGRGGDVLGLIIKGKYKLGDPSKNPPRPQNYNSPPSASGFNSIRDVINNYVLIDGKDAANQGDKSKPADDVKGCIDVLTQDQAPAGYFDGNGNCFPVVTESGDNFIWRSVANRTAINWARATYKIPGFTGPDGLRTNADVSNLSGQDQADYLSACDAVYFYPNSTTNPDSMLDCKVFNKNKSATTLVRLG